MVFSENFFSSFGTPPLVLRENSALPFGNFRFGFPEPRLFFVERPFFRKIPSRLGSFYHRGGKFSVFLQHFPFFPVSKRGKTELLTVTFAGRVCPDSARRPNPGENKNGNESDRLHVAPFRRRIVIPQKKIGYRRTFRQYLTFITKNILFPVFYIVSRLCDKRSETGDGRRHVMKKCRANGIFLSRQYIIYYTRTASARRCRAARGIVPQNPDRSPPRIRPEFPFRRSRK